MGGVIFFRLLGGDSSWFCVVLSKGTQPWLLLTPPGRRVTPKQLLMLNLQLYGVTFFLYAVQNQSLCARVCVSNP